MDSADTITQLYTPAMMAEMLAIPVRAIRLWLRTGLITPHRVVMKVPYFDYTELATTKGFATWVKQGLTPQSIVRQVTALCELSGAPPDASSGLPIALQGKRLVLSQGSVLLESTGQLQLGFDASDDEEGYEPVTLKYIAPRENTPTEYESLRGMLEAAMMAEESEDLEGAAEWYRTALNAYGPSADVNFQLAEVLYRAADLSAARERYYCAIELDPQLVEARANLGCVLAECGQTDLAVAAFQGALQLYADYADVHFHLARVLDEIGRDLDAKGHWQRFVELAPASPWADEAHERLQLQSSLNYE